MITKEKLGVLVSSLLCIGSTLATARATEPGATQIAKWHDDKQAPFTLMFDDSMTGHIKRVLAPT